MEGIDRGFGVGIAASEVEDEPKDSCTGRRVFSSVRTFIHFCKHGSGSVSRRNCWLSRDCNVVGE